MNIQKYRNPNLNEVVNELNRRKIGFEREEYSCLLTDNSVIISEDAKEHINSDALQIWDWLKATYKIYNDCMDSKSESVQDALEWGLSDLAIRFQRESSKRFDMPRLGRLDSVVLEPCQKIAEIQWKGGGEGFISEIQDVFNSFSCNSDTYLLNNLCDGLGSVFSGCDCFSDTVNVLNTGRQIWMKTENGLKEKLKEYNVNLISLPPIEAGERLCIKEDRVCLYIDGRYCRLNYIYLDRLSEVVSEELFIKIVDAYWNGQVVLDPPPSYLFNQKVSLALPFCDEYKDLFHEQLRKILIPSALIAKGKINLSALIPYIDHKNRDLLSEVNRIEDLCRLPAKLRENLIIKCASSNKYNCHGGHAVWRLWGSKSVVEKNIGNIAQAINSTNEPWIIQPYVSETEKIPFAHPDELSTSQIMKAHARYGIYYGVVDGRPGIIGSIATLSPFWKVAGKTASYDSNGRLFGSAFTDIRVKKEKKNGKSTSSR